MHNAQPLDIAQRLVDAGVPSIIIGGHAVNFHGFPRSTQDVDIIYQRSPSRLDRSGQSTRCLVIYRRF